MAPRERQRGLLKKLLRSAKAHFGWMVLTGAWLAQMTLGAPAGDSGVAAASAEAVYAAFTINLTRFITWPEQSLGPAGSPFIIGTFPRDPINAELDEAARGESVGGHPVRTIRLNSPDDVGKCHLIFLSRGVADAGLLLAHARQRPILTVSDADDFLARGGHVQFVPTPPHTRLHVSAVNLRACGLEARSQLLRLATAP